MTVTKVPFPEGTKVPSTFRNLPFTNRPWLHDRGKPPRHVAAPSARRARAVGPETGPDEWADRIRSVGSGPGRCYSGSCPEDEKCQAYVDLYPIRQ